MNTVLITALSIVILASPALAQVGVPNSPTAPTTTPPPPGSPPGTLPTAIAPFGNVPHPLNNPHPMLPGAGISGTGWYGVPIRQIYMPPQAVPVVVYVPPREVTGEQWDTQYTELPGYYVTETTLGYIYPQRWGLYSPAKGMYQWQRVPSAFQPK